MGKYFGTDGFRGEANKELTADHAYRVGRFLGWYYGECKRRNGDHTRPRIVIGKDTRRSSYMFEYSLVAGLTASGADAYLLHVTTTPSVAYIARVDDFDCGITISRRFSNAFRIVTLDGQVLNRGGSMTGGSISRSAGILSRAGELRELTARRGSLAEKLDLAAKAAEDAKRKEEIDTRNQGDQMVYQTERTLEELGDKVDAAEKAEVESKLCVSTCWIFTDINPKVIVTAEVKGCRFVVCK